MADTTRRPGLNTRAIHVGERPDPITGALAPNLTMSTTYVFETAEQGAEVFGGEREGFAYSRYGNPTVAILERKVADLEGGEAGLATASGMAAVFSATMPFLHSGDHIVSCDGVYSGTYNLFAERYRALGIETTFVDGADADAFAAAIRPNTRLLYLETPGNPTLKLIDLAAVTRIARRAGVITVADNTFATPVFQRPLELGVDVVLHSATKYLCGHGDAIAGVVVGSSDFIQRANREMIRIYGGILSPFNAWLIVRGMHTLALRVEYHARNAQRVAEFLEKHARVEWVAYPGLRSFPQHALARRQMRGFGSMVCFEVKGGVDAGRRMMNRVKLCSLAVSLGDVKSLITHPASMTHRLVPRENRLASGITDGLVRLSVGCENVEDILADLEQALE
ncbi:MAG: trans-sulfuration enzyme family protein [Chloroflexota bacterium]